MVRSRRVASRLVWSLCALGGCSPGSVVQVPDDVAIVGDGWPEDVARHDANDLGAAPDVAPDAVADLTTPDVVTAPPDVAAPPDAPAPTDVAAPPDAGCSPLPPPVARPPAPGPNGEAVVRALAAERPDWLRDSCVEMGGHRRFLFELLRRGRSVDPRWGLDRRTGPLSGDIVTYFYGDGCAEGSREVYMFDVIVRHCARPGVDEPAAPGWLDRTPEGGVWTLMGYDPSILADAGAPPPDAPPPPPDATTARPPLPDGSGVVRAVAAERPDLLRNSCVDMGGNNDFLFEVVRRLRRMDSRWGLNWKRGRVGDMSQDVVDYYYGPAGAPMEGSPDTYVVDMIGGHCGPTPSPAWIDVTGVGGALALWTLAGRTDL